MERRRNPDAKLSIFYSNNIAEAIKFIYLCDRVLLRLEKNNVSEHNKS